MPDVDFIDSPPRALHTFHTGMRVFLTEIIGPGRAGFVAVEILGKGSETVTVLVLASVGLDTTAYRPGRVIEVERGAHAAYTLSVSHVCGAAAPWPREVLAS